MFCVCVFLVKICAVVFKSCLINDIGNIFWENVWLGRAEESLGAYFVLVMFSSPQAIEQLRSLRAEWCGWWQETGPLVEGRPAQAGTAHLTLAVASVSVGVRPGAGLCVDCCVPPATGQCVFTKILFAGVEATLIIIPSLVTDQSQYEYSCKILS